MVAPDRRVGLISQIPVYPDGYTVEDVLRSAFERMFRMKEEMDRLTEQMAAGDSSSQTLKRYGELTARFEGLGGYDTDTAVNKVANGLSIDTEMRQRLFDQLSGGKIDDAENICRLAVSYLRDGQRTEGDDDRLSSPADEAGGYTDGTRRGGTCLRAYP